MSKILIDEATVKLALEALMRSRKAVSGDLDLAGCAYGKNDPDGHRYDDAKKALETLDKAITALREALAEPDFWEGYVPEPDKRQQALDKKAENARELGLDYEPAQQEPVAWMTKTGSVWKTKADETDQPLYTSPPAQRTWQGLTDEDIDYLCELAYENDEELILTVQAKLKEKNT